MLWAEGPVVVGEGGIQLASRHRLAEGLQQRFELLLQLLLLGLDGGDRIEQRIDGVHPIRRSAWRV